MEKVVVKPCKSIVRAGQLAMFRDAKMTFSLLIKDSVTNEPMLPSGWNFETLRDRFPSVYDKLVIKGSSGKEAWVEDAASKVKLTINQLGIKLNKEKEMDLFWSELLKAGIYREVGMKEEAVTSDQKYFIYDEEAEAVVKKTKYENLAEALVKLKKFSADEKIQLLSLYGQETKAVTEIVAESKLYDFIEKNPAKFLDKIKDKVHTWKLIDLNLMIEYGILRIQNYNYMYNDKLIGANEDAAIKFLDMKENNVLRAQLVEELEKKRREYK